MKTVQVAENDEHYDSYQGTKRTSLKSQSNYKKKSIAVLSNESSKLTDSNTEENKSKSTIAHHDLEQDLNEVESSQRLKNRNSAPPSNYVLPTAFFAYIKDAAGHSIMVNIKCCQINFMNHVRNVSLKTSQDLLDLVTLNGDVVGVSKMDANSNLEEVLIGRETYIPVVVVIEEEYQTFVSMESCFTDAVKLEAWYKIVKETLDNILDGEATKRKNMKAEEERIRKLAEIAAKKAEKKDAANVKIKT